MPQSLPPQSADGDLQYFRQLRPGLMLWHSPRKNSDIKTRPLTQPTFEQRDINANEGQVKMSGFVVTPLGLGDSSKQELLTTITGRQVWVCQALRR